MTGISRGRSGRWLLIALALGLLIALAIVGAPDSASGTSHTVVAEDAGILLLSTGPDKSDNYIEYYPDAVLPADDGTPATLGTPETPRQPLISGRCDAVLDGTLLSITPSGGNGRAGIVSNGIGVKARNNCATAEGRVGPGQSLEFALGSRFEGLSYQFKTIEVDVEGKFNAQLRFTLKTDGIDGFTDNLELRNGSDNGSDSGARDNDIAVAGDPSGSPFDTITFEPIGQSNSEISIEGGGDGAVPGGHLRPEFRVDDKTLFHLVKTYEGELSCDNDSDEELGTDPGDAAVRAMVIRQANKDGCPADGDPIPYNLEITDEGVLFDPNIGTRNDLNFLVRIDWAPHADPFDPPARWISLDGVSYDLVVACLSQDLSGGLDPDLDPDADDVFIHPADAPWCMAGQRQVLFEDTELWQEIQWHDGTIDPNWR